MQNYIYSLIPLSYNQHFLGNCFYMIYNFINIEAKYNMHKKLLL